MQMLFYEVYNPSTATTFVGKMDYLYDKVETYDKLKVIQGSRYLMGFLTFNEE
jgi:hypothetical protein